MRTLNLKGILCLVAILLFFHISRAQVSNVSIGTETINGNAILWLKSTGNQGLLLPVITNRSNFTGLNNSDDKGMLIYDASDNKVYFWNGSQWVEAGGGVGGGGAQTLTLSGNTFTLSGSPASNVNISSSAPASGQALVWNGSQWVATSLAGDVTGAVGSTVVSGLKGKAIPNLPSTTNALVYDGTAWSFQALSSTGEANTASNVGTGGQGVFKQKSALNLEFYKINAGSNKVSVALDGANNEIDIDINNLNLVVAATQVTGLGTLATLSAITSAQITDGSITSADILDGEIKNVDIQDGAVTGNKISIPGATTGQVIKFNGSTWTAQADDVGAGATPTLGNGQLLTGNGTANSATTVTGDVALSGGALTIKSNVVTTAMIQSNAVDGTKLADNSVNSAQIVNGAVTGAKISTTGASLGQVLKYDGTTWTPQNDDTGSSIILANGQLLTGNGTVNSATAITGDIALSGGAMTIKTNVVTTGMIQALAVDGTKLADNSITSVKISDGSVASADILDGAVSSLDIANGAVSTVDILDGAVTGAKISTTGASLGQVLKYDGTTWLPQSDNTGSGFSTANEVPRGDGTTLVSSNIYSDGTNVGIGTNAPSSILELQGGNLILSGSSGSPLDPVDIDFKTFADVFKAKIWTDPAANTLWFSTSTTPTGRKDITIDPSGNVGIGTTSPTQKLDVREGGISITHSTSSATLNIHSPNVGGASNQITFQKGGVTNWALGGANIGSAGPTDFSLYNYTTASNALTVSSANGNVGIATTTPAYALTIGAGHFAMENSAQLVAKNSGGAYESYLWPRYSDDIMYLNYGAGGFAVRNNASVNTMFMTSGGNVGIGTTTPQAPLHIASNSGTAGSVLAYTLWNQGAANLSSSSGNFINNAIRADGNVWCNGFAFVATSDKRIKTVLGKTNNQKDLNKLMNIEITDYQFIDTISQGDRVHKKVIAQQLEAVYPNAINKTSGVIPNVFETAKQVKVEGKKTIIETSKPHQFVTGDEVKLVLEQGGEKQFKVTVLNEKEFEVGEVISGKIFVYGKNVNDLLTVDYDALTTLNISATQQLSKEVDSLKSKLNDRDIIAELKASLKSIQSEKPSISTYVDYARPFHSGASDGNLYFNAFSGGDTYINWFSGTSVNVRNGAFGYGPIFTSAFTVSSSRRFKKDIVDTQYGLADVLKLQGKEYKYIRDSTNRNEVGFIAEEVEEIIPEVVMKAKDGTIQGLDYGKFSPVLVEAIKQQQKQIEDLKQELIELQAEKKSLKSENESLESNVKAIESDLTEIKNILGIKASKN